MVVNHSWLAGTKQVKENVVSLQQGRKIKWLKSSSPVWGINWHVMDGRNRSDVKIGTKVGIVLKGDQRTGRITEGIVQNLLTNSQFHPHGIKVRLTTGEIGRVKQMG